MQHPLAKPAAPLDEGERWLPLDDRFIPIEVGELTRRLLASSAVFGAQSDELAPVFEALRQRIELESVSLHDRIDHAYAAFNPDRETLPTDSSDAHEPGDGPIAMQQALRRLRHLLDKANYQQLSEIDIDAALRQASRRQIRVRIDPERVDLLEVWVRGQHEIDGKERSWRRPFRGGPVRVAIFRRMAVVARLRNDPNLLVKLFKDVPQSEVEALLPHAEATMTLFDRCKVFFGSAGAMSALGMNLMKVAALAGAIWNVAWVVGIGLGTLAIRTFFGYRNVRRDRDWRRTRALYFQNLANNAAALHTLLASVKHEELKETMLAYAFCQRRGGELWTQQSLRTEIEGFLRNQMGVEVDFDLPDALQTIRRLGLWQDAEKLQAVPPAEAVTVLQRLRVHLCTTGDPSTPPRPAVLAP